jgi:galactosyl transferase GMA12/MNN10 family
MRKAIATLGTGPAAAFLHMALPSFTTYGERHGYDVIVGAGDSDDRPQAWGKVRLVQRVLQSYNFVLWLDCDVVILDGSQDIEAVVPEECFQAFAVVELPEDRGHQVLTGVWALRREPRALRFLDQVWDQRDLIHHRLWEQAAVMSVSGWTTEPPFAKERSSPWDEGTFILDEAWNMVPWLPIGYSAGKIRHYPRPWSDRRRRFDMRTDTSIGGRNLFGRLERQTRAYYRPITARIKAVLGRAV